MLKFQDGIRVNSQARVRDEINLHNQGEKAVSKIECKWYDEFTKDNFKHKFYMTNNLWEEAQLPSL
jgi:hypothetical protein